MFLFHSCGNLTSGTTSVVYASFHFFEIRTLIDPYNFIQRKRKSFLLGQLCIYLPSACLISPPCRPSISAYFEHLLICKLCARSSHHVLSHLSSILLFSPHPSRVLPLVPMFSENFLLFIKLQMPFRVR